jgi:hypothetical protein
MYDEGEGIPLDDTKRWRYAWPPIKAMSRRSST